jgi:hypothetical protein
MDSIETLEVVPDQVSLMESMRAVGYSVGSRHRRHHRQQLSANVTLIHVKYGDRFIDSSQLRLALSTCAT